MYYRPFYKFADETPSAPSTATPKDTGKKAGEAVADNVKEGVKEGVKDTGKKGTAAAKKGGNLFLGASKRRWKRRGLLAAGALGAAGLGALGGYAIGKSRNGE